MSLNLEQLRVLFIDLDQCLLYRGDEDEDYEWWEGESWLLLTVAFGADREEHIKIYKEYRQRINGSIENDQKVHEILVEKLIKLWKDTWKNGPITRQTIENICEIFTEKINSEALVVMREFINQGILPIIGTGGLVDVAKVIAQAIGAQEAVENTDLAAVDMWFGNTSFIYDESGVLIGFNHQQNIVGTKIKQADTKLNEIRDALGNQKIPIQTIAVGDGKSDIGLFMQYPGIAFRSTDEDLIAESKGHASSWAEVFSIAMLHFDQTPEINRSVA